ncbi:MAG: TM2 domain-containing protein [Prevotella sp.]|nr:TM2 domain-containing protein [Prevotella sp.]MBR3480462.1 TM2 domain-containing protein [Prevotella sp.]MBR6187715.1 TM2 domain-containing protein [Prevotella sp.]
MSTEQIDQIVKENYVKISPESEETIRQKLVGADEGMAQTAFANLKSPTTVLLVSIFLGALGIDRFLLGQKLYGVLKLVTAGGCGIWTIVDWFTTGERTRAYNTKNILEVLNRQ